MNGQTIVDYDKIPEDTKAWLKENHAHYYKTPQVCSLPYRGINGEIVQDMTYGIDYLVNTPIKQIIEKRENFGAFHGGVSATN